MVFPESVVQYPRGDISVSPRGLHGPLQPEVIKYRNLDTVEGHPRTKLGNYNFDKAAKELRSKYGLSNIYNKGILNDWNNYEAIYRNFSHGLTA